MVKGRRKRKNNNIYALGEGTSITTLFSSFSFSKAFTSLYIFLYEEVKIKSPKEEEERQDFLAKCIRSLMAQTMHPLNGVTAARNGNVLTHRGNM